MAKTAENAHLIDQFVAALEQRAPRPLSVDDLVRLTELEQYDRKELKRQLEARVADGTLRRIGKTRYQWRRPEPPPTVGGESRRADTAAPRGAGRNRREPAAIEGHYSRVRTGYGFVEVLDRHAARFPRDILIPAGSEGEALHGDRVVVEIIRRDFRRHRFVGRITAVTQRVHEHMIGTLRRARHGWLVVPQSELLPTIRLVGEQLPEREQEGLVAKIRITPPSPETGTGRRRTQVSVPEGELEEILGDADDPDVQFLTLASEHGLAIEFSAAALAAAENLPDHPDEADFEGREDLRALPFVTIDGETARDFDDAVCVEDHDEGYRVWVAIADVSHYVRPRSAIDIEAGQRGTSVYFPDRAIPMLPPALSSRLCSLLPSANRLVLVAEMTYDKAARRQHSRFYPAVIRSQARLTYTRVAEWLAGARPAPGEEPFVPLVQRMQQLMQKLYRRRVQAGSLDMDLPEAMIELSEEGRSIGVRTLARNDAHRIIEEMMLEANRAVAELLGKHQVAIPYRVHEPPHPDSIDELNQFLGFFGFHVDFEDEVRPQDVQRTLKQMAGHRLERVLTRQLLRSLTKAHYSTRNSGHFGLAFADYCHFTSPIRRYPDLLVHRQLRAHLASTPCATAEDLEPQCLHSSQAEREAMEAERDMVDLRKAELMAGHLHERDAATVVSVTDFGFYVELDRYPIEGLVRLEDLTDDRYRLNETERALEGARTRRRIRLGDRVEVECIEASTRSRKIDFHLLCFLERAERPPRDRSRAKTRRDPRSKAAEKGKRKSGGKRKERRRSR